MNYDKFNRLLCKIAQMCEEKNIEYRWEGGNEFWIADIRIEYGEDSVQIKSTDGKINIDNTYEKCANELRSMFNIK